MTLKAGERHIFAYATPEVGNFGAISLYLGFASPEASHGTLSISMDGTYLDGFDGKSVSFAGFNSSATISYSAARPNHVYVFEIFNNSDLLLSDVNLTLQDCNKIGGHGPECKWQQIPELTIEDETKEYLFTVEPYKNTDYCGRGWCYFVLDSCSPMIEVNTSFIFPHVYLKSENTPTEDDLDVAFDITDSISYQPQATRDAATTTYVGFRYISELSAFTISMRCYPEDRWTTAEIIGLVIGCVAGATLVLAVMYYCLKRRIRYQTIG